jgi:uncharacterized delta-60 repeat protein
MKIKFNLMALAAVLFAASFSFAADGDPDPTFAGGGKVLTAQLTDRNGADDIMRIQPNGRILVASNYNDTQGGGGIQTIVTRYFANGSVDTSFGFNGTVLLGQNRFKQAYAMAVQPDGKILVSGEGALSRCGTTRLNENGTFDASFGTVTPNTPVGTVLTQVDIFCSARAVAVQTDGRIVVGGFSNHQGPTLNTTAMVAIRYNADGSVDGSHGTNGIAKTTYENHYYGGGVTLQLQADGKIVESANRLYADVSQDGDVCLIRFNSDGSLDSGFGTGGSAVAVTPARETIAATALQPDGKVVVASYSEGGAVLTRFNTDGSLDSSFGSSGLVVNSSVAMPASDGGGALLVQADSKILLGGSVASAGGGRAFAITRFNSDGTIDSSLSPDKLSQTGTRRGIKTESIFAPQEELWGSGGTVTADFGGARFGQVRGMVFDAVGRLVAAGRVGETNISSQQM